MVGNSGSFPEAAAAAERERRVCLRGGVQGVKDLPGARPAVRQPPAAGNDGRHFCGALLRNPASNAYFSLLLRHLAKNDGGDPVCCCELASASISSDGVGGRKG